MDSLVGNFEARSTITDKNGNVHVPIGKVSFEPDALQTNLAAVMEELARVKPSSAKGRYVRKVVVSSSMGPGVKIDENEFA